MPEGRRATDNYVTSRSSLTRHPRVPFSHNTKGFWLLFATKSLHAAGKTPHRRDLRHRIRPLRRVVARRLQVPRRSTAYHSDMKGLTHDHCSGDCQLCRFRCAKCDLLAVSKELSMFVVHEQEKTEGTEASLLRFLLWSPVP